MIACSQEVPPPFVRRSRSDRCKDIPADGLEILVIRPGTTLGRGPGDDAVGVLDVAGFAMHAVGGIDAQHLAARTVVYHLVDARRTEALAGVAELPRAARGADRGVGHLQMRRLRLLVRVAGEEHR